MTNKAEIPLPVAEKCLLHARKLCGRVLEKILARNFETGNGSSLQFALIGLKIEKTSASVTGNVASEQVSNILRTGLFHFNEKVIFVIKR